MADLVIPEDLRATLKSVADALNTSCAPDAANTIPDNLVPQAARIVNLLPAEVRGQFAASRNFDATDGSTNPTQVEIRAVIIAAAQQLDKAGMLGNDSTNHDRAAMSAEGFAAGVADVYHGLTGKEITGLKRGGEDCGCTP